MDDSAEAAERLARRCSPLVAQYAVAMAYRIRFYMRMNAREAMHVIELRTTPQGHPAYRRVCQRMHDLIASQAGHAAIAEAITFADHSAVELERLESERALDRKRGAAGGGFRISVRVPAATGHADVHTPEHRPVSKLTAGPPKPSHVGTRAGGGVADRPLPRPLFLRQPQMPDR